MDQSSRGERLAGWIWLSGAFVILLAISTQSSVGALVVAPLLSFAMGAGAARWVQTAQSGSPRQAILAAVLVGVGGLLASIAAFSVPEPPVATSSVVVGPSIGLLNLGLATFGGLLVGCGRAMRPAPQ